MEHREQLVNLLTKIVAHIPKPLQRRSNIPLSSRSESWSLPSSSSAKTEISEFPEGTTPPSTPSTPSTPLLLIDISGFTPLSKVLPVIELSSTINSYFEGVLEVLSLWGGEVIKFAGDAIFAKFPASVHGLKLAVNAANEIIQRRGEKTEGENLGVHCGLSFDVLEACICTYQYNAHSSCCCYDAGTNNFFKQTHRSEYYIYGPAVKSVTSAVSLAHLGECYCCSGAASALNRDSAGVICKFGEELSSESIVHDTLEALRRDHEKCIMVDDFANLDDESLVRLYRFWNTFVVRSTMQNTIDCGHLLGSEETFEAYSGKLESQLRYTMFCRVAGGNAESVLGEIFGKAASCDKFNGELRQFICDNNGHLLVFTFNGACEEALDFAFVLREGIAEIEIESISLDVGISFGKVFEGLIGSRDRHESGIFGSSVILAARLVDCCMMENANIVVDASVVKESLSSSLSSSHSQKYHFEKKVECITLKGFEDGVEIYNAIQLS